MTSNRTILFTGGAGFIGRHVMPMLIERGDEVRLFDSMTHRAERADVDEWVATGQVELIEQDVRYGGAVQRAIRGCTHVIHFATVSINKSVADPDESVDINFVGTHNVIAAAAAQQVQRIVYASSASVYGEPETLPMSEDDQLDPMTPYCIGKLAGEHLLRFYERQTGLSWNALRFFNVYGPGQKTGAYYTSVINHFVDRVKKGEPPIIDGRGEQSMDFVHVHDVARAVVAALDSERWGKPINIGTGISTTVAQHADIVVKAIGADVTPVFRPREVLVSKRAADIRRAHDMLGWKPMIPVEDGLAELAKLEFG
jgi:UDP-glucose 4-epimerase